MRNLLFSLTLLLVWGASIAQVKDSVNMDFKKADSVARAFRGHPIDNLELLSTKLTTPLSTDVTKFRSIYTWVCLNIKNDYTLNLKNQNARKKLKDPKAIANWNRDFSKDVFKKLLKSKSTVCTGYSYLIRELARYAGIRVEIVDGYGRTVAANIGGTGSINHSWNAVQLNNKWYLCDPTWSSGAIDLQLKEFVPKYNDAYFLLDPNAFIRNHYPVDTSYFLTTKKVSLHEFLNRPIVYSYFFDYKFIQLTPDTLEIVAKKNESLNFEFADGKKFPGKVELQINDHPSFEITPDQKDSTLRFNYGFLVKGSYILHVKLDGNFVVTYKVSVK